MLVFGGKFLGHIQRYDKLYCELTGVAVSPNILITPALLHPSSHTSLLARSTVTPILELMFDRQWVKRSAHRFLHCWYAFRGIYEPEWMITVETAEYAWTISVSAEVYLQCCIKSQAERFRSDWTCQIRCRTATHPDLKPLRSSDLVYSFFAAPAIFLHISSWRHLLSRIEILRVRRIAFDTKQPEQGQINSAANRCNIRRNLAQPGMSVSTMKTLMTTASGERSIFYDLA